MECEWDDTKSNASFVQHRFDFACASRVFLDDDGIIDPGRCGTAVIPCARGACRRIGYVGSGIPLGGISGSFEERGEYAGDVLGTKSCRIVLCSLQYTEDVRETLDYLIEQDFQLYIQWLNPGFSDPDQVLDQLNLVDEILSQRSTFSIRDGRITANDRVQELRQFIYGWAKYRSLLFSC